MSINRVMIQMDYERNLKMQLEYHQAIARLPRGSITTKKVNGHMYFYWVYRKNGKVINRYISMKDNDVAALMGQVRMRRMMERHLRELKAEQLAMERYLRLFPDDSWVNSAKKGRNEA